MVRDGAMRLLTMRVGFAPPCDTLILRNGHQAASRRMATIKDEPHQDYRHAPAISRRE